MALSPLQRRVLIGLLAAIVAASLFALTSRALTPALPDQVVFRPAPNQPRYALVQVSGAVARPGLYWVFDGTRAGALIERAGGLTGDADPSKVNLAARLHDGDHIYVPPRARPPDFTPPPDVDRTQVRPLEVRPAGGTGAAPGSPVPARRINVNTATVEELQGLPGIGPVLAVRIVESRQRHGPFTSAHDLERVEGIGRATATRLAPYLSF